MSLKEDIEKHNREVKSKTDFSLKRKSLEEEDLNYLVKEGKAKKYYTDGKYTIINGDCLEVMKDIPDNSISLIVTDPPYKVTARGNAGNSGGMMQSKLSMKGKIFKYNDIKPIEYIPEFYRILKDGSHCYIMTNHVNLQEILNVATECGFKFIKSLVWNKGNKIMGQFYMSQFEYILFFRKGKGKKLIIVEQQIY